MRPMARPPKRKVPGGGHPRSGGSKRTTPSASSRYTPPVPPEVKTSSRLVPIVMFTLLGAGLVVIVLNYVGVLPGATSNWYLVGGLGLILAGIITATQWR